MRALRRAAAALPAASRRSHLSRRRVRGSEPTPSDSARPQRGGAASCSSFRVLAGLRSGSARALAGAFVLLALGVLAAPQAEAQTPTLTGLTVTPVAGTTDKLDVSWNEVSSALEYDIQWKTGSQEYSDSRRRTIFQREAKKDQISGLTVGTTYTVRVIAYNASYAVIARSETTATTNDYPPVSGLRVTPVAGSTEALDVSWNAVPNLTKYHVQWKSGNQTYSDSRRTEVNAPSNSTIPLTATITGLTGGTRYAVRVTAISDKGVAARSEATATTNADHDGRRNIKPSDPDRVPRNVTLSASGLVTWTLDEATERDTTLPYSVEWIAATRPVADMKWGWGDDHIMGSDYAGIEEHTCYDAGRCQVQIEDFDPEWHYLVHVNTAERAYGTCPRWCCGTRRRRRRARRA